MTDCYTKTAGTPVGDVPPSTGRDTLTDVPDVEAHEDTSAEETSDDV